MVGWRGAQQRTKPGEESTGHRPMPGVRPWVPLNHRERPGGSAETQLERPGLCRSQRLHCRDDPEKAFRGAGG